MMQFKIGDEIILECKYFHSCDGCQLQNLNYQKQLELKQYMYLVTHPH